MTKIKNNKVVRGYSERDWFIIRGTNSTKGRVRLGQVMFDGEDIGKEVTFTVDIKDNKKEKNESLLEKEKNDE